MLPISLGIYSLFHELIIGLLVPFNKTSIQAEMEEEQIGVEGAAAQDHEKFMKQPILFRDALNKIECYSNKCWVYLPATESWRIDSPCFVLESEEVSPDREDDPDAGIPDIAKQHNMMQALSVGEVQDLVANAKMQRKDIDAEVLFSAFLYYYDNDSYIEL